MIYRLLVKNRLILIAMYKPRNVRLCYMLYPASVKYNWCCWP